jgi:hypothetical protein
MRHVDAIEAFALTPDGARIATISRGEPMVRIWDVPVGSSGDVPALQQLAEALDGHRVRDDGVLVDLRDAERQTAIAQLQGGPTNAGSAGDRFITWFLQDPASRSVTPLGTLAPGRYVRVLVDQRTESARREARRAFSWLRTAWAGTGDAPQADSSCRPGDTSVQSR